MNAIDSRQVFFRSLATRRRTSEVPEALDDVVAACGRRVRPGDRRDARHRPGRRRDHRPRRRVALRDDAGVRRAASQLEKIDMLDFADVVAINKFERRGAEDALRDVRRQLVRNREAFDARGRTCRSSARARHGSTTTASPASTSTCAGGSPPTGCASRRARSSRRRHPGLDRPGDRAAGRESRYLAEIAETVRSLPRTTERSRAPRPRAPAARGRADMLAEATERPPPASPRRGAAPRSLTPRRVAGKLLAAYSGDEQVSPTRQGIPPR
jgi:isobutyryl-CoA mutase